MGRTPPCSGGADLATNTDVIEYILDRHHGGASGVAQVTVTSDTDGEGSAAAVAHLRVAVHRRHQGPDDHPDLDRQPDDGMTYTVWLMPAGLQLDPISDNFQSTTLVMHKDGVKHVMPGSFGTFEVTAMAGNYATVKWTFTGSWTDADRRRQPGSDLRAHSCPLRCSSRA